MSNQILKKLGSLSGKERAKEIINCCQRGMQICHECPLIDCCDNTSPIKRKLIALEEFADFITQDHWRPLKYAEMEPYTRSCGCTDYDEDADYVDCQECQHEWDGGFFGGNCIGTISGCADCLCESPDLRYSEEIDES